MADGARDPRRRPVHHDPPHGQRRGSHRALDRRLRRRQDPGRQTVAERPHAGGRRARVSNDLPDETRFVRPAGRPRARFPSRSERAGSGALRLASRDPRARAANGRGRSPSTTRSFLEAVAHVIGGALDRAETELELRRRALEDPLTGLANRALLSTQLEAELRHARRLGPSRVPCSRSTSTASSSSTTRSGTPPATRCCARSPAGSARCVREEDLVARPGRR